MYIGLLFSTVVEETIQQMNFVGPKHPFASTTVVVAVLNVYI